MADRRSGACEEVGRWDGGVESEGEGSMVGERFVVVYVNLWVASM